ncbi:hypothetical protein ASG73_10760 [Janibacter sp. Soil728]|uniref:hypothetical protein n=1 Tax=Janibacter sp. Soil728 TaxID=1736393 RepID=UPI0006FC5697|nr:hypothetical protein [Janibacter sp. Soil728]KRE36811.1 hypothetical protein ASG73_10760 [Janibacter sp. Soil728]
MPQSAEEIHQLARSRTDAPDLGFVEWPAFPWAVDGGRIVAKELDPPADHDRVRDGEGGVDCWRCEHPDEGVVWRNERWILSTDREGRGGLLTLWLQTREHMDFGDMGEDLAAEFGRLTLRLHNAMLALPNAGRVHLGKWGDGSAHLHVLAMVRPARLPQVIGSFAVEWDDLLPPVPEDVWQREVDEVAVVMATGDAV